MINPQELKIGNWVDSTDNDNINLFIKIEAIDDVGVNFYVSQAGLEYEAKFVPSERYNHRWIKPIELTPEILENCGFKKWGHSENDVNYMLTHESFGLATISWNSEGNYCYLEFESTSASQKIKYLHQLQNLVFALTGEELTVNL